MQKKKIQSFSFSRKMLMWWTKIMKRKGYTYIFSSLLKKVISSFLWCLWRLSAASGWSWTSLSQPLAARNSLKWTMNANFIHFMRSIWPQELLQMLRVKSGRVRWFESVVGITNKVSPWRPMALTDGRVCVLLSKGHSYHRPRRTGGAKTQICLGLHCGCQSQCSQLG